MPKKNQRRAMPEQPGSAKPATKRASRKDHQTVRSELNRLANAYQLIRDCLAGEDAVKGLQGGSIINFDSNPSAYNGGGTSMFNFGKAQRYLPMPNPDDTSPENKSRYAAYVQRAVYYNVTGRTLEGMVGQVYLIPPVIDAPAQLDAMQKNCDGQGLTILQNSKKAVRYASAYGRAGLFVDYDKTETPATVKDIADGVVQPIMRVVAPWNVINWRTKTVGTKTFLAQVVIREVIDEDEQGYANDSTEQYRVLELDDAGFYRTTVIDSDGEQEIYPTDSKGNKFKYIPFTFIGSENNDPAVDKPPMFDLAKVNIAHYRNSADVEESSFITGQPTVVVTGLTQQWWEDVLKKKIAFGSRGGIVLPVSATANLLQANPNNLPRELMKDKEDQMVAIGAKLVIQKRVQKTATEAIVDSSSESSVLSNVSSNVSAAFEQGMKWAAEFVGAVTDAIKFELNKDFELNRLTADDLAKLVANWQKGAVTFSEMRQGLRKAGMATEDDDVALEKIKKEHAELVATGMIADPFEGTVDAVAAPAPDPNNDPAGHARQPATRGQ